VLPLCRLRYAGSASLWGFAIYLASTDGYQDSVLPSALPVGTPEEALDCACGLYLTDPTAWQEHLPTGQLLTTHELPYVSTKAQSGRDRSKQPL
jgi:hypothetical protein